MAVQQKQYRCNLQGLIILIKEPIINPNSNLDYFFNKQCFLLEHTICSHFLATTFDTSFTQAFKSRTIFTAWLFMHGLI